MADTDFIFDVLILCFQNFVRILLKYTTLIFSQIFDNIKKKFGSSSFPCEAGNIVVLDGINLGMFWLCHFPHRLCPHPNGAYTYVQAMTQLCMLSNGSHYFCRIVMDDQHLHFV